MAFSPATISVTAFVKYFAPAAPTYVSTIRDWLRSPATINARVVIYVAADIGSIAGGWISSALLKSGRTLNFARKTAMLLCALCVVPMVFASWIQNLWGTVALISLAAAAHQGRSANLYTLVSDTFPRRAVGSVVGIGGMAGAVGNMAASAGIGYVLQFTGNNYNSLLTICSFAYVAALGVIHWLVPRLEPAKVESATVS